ncbi:Phosphoesterase domain protein, partial [mine drainage metagenome]
MPIGGKAVDYSSGPPNSVLKGEMWLLYMIDAIMQSPIWNSTAIFLTFDEGGGFYDQMAPPSVGGHMLGQRVPFILISPFSKENYVSSTVLNQASILAFIDYNWKLPALNRFVSLSN